MTYDDIFSVLGSIDDDLAVGLIATGASNWLNNDEALMGEGFRTHASANSSICLNLMMTAWTELRMEG